MAENLAPEISPAAERNKPDCSTIWLDLMRTTDILLEAGLRRKIGPDGDLQAALREWYCVHMQEHDQAVRQLVRNLNRANKERKHAG